jgi:hypothetical protein
MVMRWRGYVQALNKNGAFRDSAHNGLQIATATYTKKNTVSNV